MWSFFNRRSRTFFSKKTTNFYSHRFKKKFSFTTSTSSPTISNTESISDLKPKKWRKLKLGLYFLFGLAGVSTGG